MYRVLPRPAWPVLRALGSAQCLLWAAMLCGLALAGCSRGADGPADARLTSGKRYTSEGYGPRIVADGASVPKGGGVYKLGAPYKMGGRWYIPREEPSYDQSGVASWYGDDFHGRRTANGEIYDMHALTAAHPTLPLPSYAYVTNLDNGRTVLVRINDRGPYAHDRLIDLSRLTARVLGYEGRGLARVRVRYAGRAPLDGNDIHERRFLASQPWYGGGTYAASVVEPSRPWSPPPSAIAMRQPAAPQQAVPGYDGGSAPTWSVSSYRAGLAGRPSGLGGPSQ